MGILTFMGLSGFEVLIVILVFSFPYLYALIDVLRSSFQNKIDKLVWLIAILALPFLGALLYFLIAPKKVVN